MKDAINWFELPVVELERAQKFYETVLNQKLRAENESDGRSMAIFPSGQPGVGGALVKDPRRKPVTDGALVYLNANGTLDACLGRVVAAGGKVLLPKTDIGAPGFIALLQDTEGNQVGLHTERS